MEEKNKSINADALRKEFDRNRKRDAQEKKTEEVKIDFCCPICHNTHYNPVINHNDIMGPGSRSWVTHYVCFGCSVLFHDPVKFTEKKH